MGSLFSIYKNDLFKHKNRVIKNMPPLLKRKLLLSHKSRISYEDLLIYYKVYWGALALASYNYCGDNV